MKYPKISVLIPVFNEEAYILECMDSIINFDYPKTSLEIIFIDGNSTDSTVEIIKKYQHKYQYIKVINNPKKIVPISMNMGIKKAEGEYICRLDAHAIYPSDYLSKLLIWSKKLHADNVGAVCVTAIKKENLISKSIQFVMSDKFGVGESLFRLGISEPQEVDTVPFGFYKKEVFKKIGLYDERLIRVQDLELNKRLKQSGGKIYLVPNIECIYYPREKVISFFKNRFQTGRWVMLTAYYTQKLNSISIRHVVPLFFTLFIFLSTFLSFFSKQYALFFLLILVIYSIILYVRSFFIKRSFLLSISIVFLYFILHFSYGLGSLTALYEIIFKKKREN